MTAKRFALGLLILFLTAIVWWLAGPAKTSGEENRKTTDTARTAKKGDFAKHQPLAKPTAEVAAGVPASPAKVAPADALPAFTNWTQRYLLADPETKAKLEPEGIKLAEARRPIFKELICENPREALQRAVPMVVRQALPQTILSLIEKRVNAVGAIRVMQGVPLNLSEPPVPTYREVELQKGGTYRAYVYGQREQKLTWTAGAFVNGVALDSEFAISDEPTRRLEIGERLPEGKPVVANCPVSGKYVLEPNEVPAEVTESLAAVETPVEIITFCDGSHIAIQNQTILYGEGVTGGSFAFSGILPSSPTPALGQVKVIVLNVTYADQNALPSTEEKLYAVLRDVADHYSKASYGRLSLTGVVAPPIKLPHNEAWYVNRDSSNGGDIGGTGISMADARAEARKMGYDFNDYDCTVMRHNGGPGSYGGLGGGNTVWCRSDGVSLWAHEIGHAFGLGHSNFWDTAGTSSIGNGANNEYGDSYDIMGGAGTNGHYNAQGKNQVRWLPSSFIQSVSQSGLYRLHAFDQGSLDSSKRYAMTILKDSQRTYWGMVRSLFDTNPFVKSGLVFGWRFPNGGGGNFQLIDTSNGSPFGKTDAPISLGATFSDTESGIHVTTVAANDNPRYLDLQVNLGSFPTNTPPTMTLAASAEVIPLNGSVTFTATASDGDGDPLAFNWQHFGSTTQIVSPNSNVITRQFTSAGTYVVTCTVSDMKGGTVTRNKLITVGTVTTFTISGRVTRQGQGLSDVVITANNANGVISDADGYFTIPNLSANTYTLTPLLYGYSFSELFNNSITVGPSFSGAMFEATAQSVVTIAAHNPNANEAAPVTQGTFRLTRTGDNSQDLVVNVNSALGSATISADYTLSPAYVTGSQGFSTFTIPADSDTLNVAVTPVVDTSSEGPETVILQLGPGNGYLVGSASTATVVVADDDTTLPKVSLSATRNTVMENLSTPGQLTLSRSGNTDLPLTVNYAISGTAGNGVDFTTMAGSATLAAGASSTTIEVTPVDDAASESLETASFTLTTSAAYIIDPLATSATVTLYDDDLQTVSVAATDGSATEMDLSLPGTAADTGTFLITRSGDTSSALTIYYAFSGVTGSGVMALHGVDFEWMPGVVVIPAGQSSAAITVVPRFDGVGEGTEQVVLNLGASATNYVLGTSATATVTITDNPADVPYIDVVNTANGVEPSTNANFRFTLRGDPLTDTPVAVSFTLGGSAQNGTDYETVGWWLHQASGTSENLRAIWAANATNLWAVGDNGTILKGDGTGWTAQTSGTTQHLRAVWGTGASSVWAVGDGGVILFFNGTSWAEQTSGTTNALRGIWGSSGTNIFAVGDGGTILRSTTGTTWAASTSGITTQLRAVHGSGASNVWAVGAGGVIRFWNGTTWGAQTSGVTTQLNSVFAANSTNIWAVGNGGVVRKGSGTTWASQTSASGADLNTVWAASTTNLLISGGSSAQMVSSNGSAWSNVTLTALATFNSVFGTSATIGWAVGDGGAIFRRDSATAIAVPSSMVIPRAASTFDLSLRTKDDTDLEDLESISLSIAPNPTYQIFTPSASASAWLRDNDNVNTLIVDTQVGTGGAISFTEGATTSPVKFYISRLGSTTAAVTVNIIYGGTATMTADFTAPATVTIPAGATGVDVPVTIVNDTLAEGTETIAFEFAAGGYSRGSGAVMYITDNDTNAQTVAFVSNSAAALEASGVVNVPVTLASAATTPVTVEYAVDSGTRSSVTTSSSSPQPLPYWLRMVKTGTSFAAFASNDGTVWTQLGATQTLSGFTATNYLAGLSVGSGADGTLCTVTYDNLTINNLSAGGTLGAVTSADIGAVAAVGSWSESAGTYTVTGSGADIWGTADEFRYVWFPISSSANCTITARITAQTNTAGWAKAGVMIRETNAANSRQAMISATPSNGRTYQYRATTGGTSTNVINTSTLLRPFWLRLQRADDLYTASHSANGSTWVTLGTPQTMAFGPQALAGLAVSARNDNTTLTTAVFDNVSLTGSPSLAGRTIGFVNAQGTDSEAAGIYTLSAAGAQIGGTEDECHFLAAPVTGDFTLVARVLSHSGGNANAQAGLMVRESANLRTRSLYTGSVANAGAEFIYRTTSVTTAFGTGVDFSLPNGVLIFDVGEQTKNIPLSITNDTVDEPNDNISLLLRNPNGAQLGSLSQFTYTIIDDDHPPASPYVGFASTTGTVVENSGTAQIAVALSSPASTPGSVDYLTTNGSATEPGDFTSTTGTLSFAAGESVKFISVPITDDAVLEASETLTITLTSPVNLVLGSVNSHTLTITDDDSPAVSIVASDPTAAEAALDPGQFTVSRNGPTTEALTVNLTRTGSATSATDFAAIAATVVIPIGASSADVSVTPVQDTSSEGNETIILTVATGTGYVVGSPSSATVTLLDDDRSTVTITANDPNAAEGVGNPGQFTITRTAPFTSALSVSLTIAGTATNTTDYTTVASTVTIAASASSAVVNITPVDDGSTEGTEDVTLSLNTGTYDIGAAAFGSVSIADNDNPPTVFIDSPTTQGPLVAAANGIILNATASDDGTPAALALSWTQVSGPGTAIIESPSAATTAVTFSAPGTYVLRITATDTQFTVSDQATIAVGSGLVASNWFTQDLGPSSSRRGQGLEYNGLFTVSGTGAGYTGTADQAHLMVRPAIGDGSVVARLTSLPTTGAIAGVTIRDSLARSSTRAVLGYVPGTGLQFRTRTTVSVADTSVAAAASTLPLWLKLERNAATNEISAFYASDVSGSPGTWTAIGTPTVMPLLNSDAHYGLTTSSNSTATTATAVFDQVTLTPTPAGPALLNEDSGTTPNMAGSGSLSGSTYTIAGPTSGYFYGWQYYGDMIFTARLASYSSGAGSSSGGIRIAESIEGGAQLHLGRMPTSSYSGYYWTSIAGGGGGGVPSGIASGNWMRIVRRGNSVTGYRAADVAGSPGAWIQIGQAQTVIMTTPLFVGFYVNNASGATGTLNTCTFSGLSIQPTNKAPIINFTPPAALPPFNLSATVIDDGQPTPPGAYTLAWSQLAGPGPTTLSSPFSASTPLTLSLSGSHTFRLKADDGGLTSFGDFTFTGYTTAFSQWLDQTGSGNPSAAAVEASGDSDGDGLANLLEYAIGTNGSIQEENPQVVMMASNGSNKYLCISLPKNPDATGVTFTVQASSDLVNWSSLGLITEVDTNSQLTVRDSVPVSPGQQRFMRVVVTQQQ